MDLPEVSPLPTFLGQRPWPFSILLSHESPKLSHYLIPFHDPADAKELVFTETAQLVAVPSASIFTKLLQRVPDVEQADKIRFRILEGCVHFVRLALFLRRTFTNIHDAEPSNDDQDLPQNPPFTCLHQHATQPGIQRKACQLFPDLGKFPLPGAQRSHFLESPEALGHRPWRGRIQKGEISDVSQPQGLHPEHYSSKG